MILEFAKLLVYTVIAVLVVAGPALLAVGIFLFILDRLAKAIKMNFNRDVNESEQDEESETEERSWRD